MEEASESRAQKARRLRNATRRKAERGMTENDAIRAFIEGLAQEACSAGDPICSEGLGRPKDERCPPCRARALLEDLRHD